MRVTFSDACRHTILCSIEARNRVPAGAKARFMSPRDETIKQTSATEYRRHPDSTSMFHLPTNGSFQYSCRMTWLQSQAANLRDISSTFFRGPLPDVRHASRAQSSCHVVPDLQCVDRLRNTMNRLLTRKIKCGCC